MNTVILDGEDFASSAELHQQLKVKLKLPDFMGVISTLYGIA